MYVFKERDMKLRRLLLLSCIGFIGAIGVSHAIDVNIPGARPDIRKEAYQEYRIQGEFAKKVDDYQASEVKKWAQHEPNYDNEKLDDDIYIVQEMTRAIHHSKSVYIITDNGADIKFTGSKEKYSKVGLLILNICLSLPLRVWEELLTPYLILDMKQDNSLKDLNGKIQI